MGSLRILQWNAGGMSQSKRAELLQNLNRFEIDVFTIMEANLNPDKLKYFPFRGYTLYVLPKSRKVASGILVGVKSDLTADFKIVKTMDENGDDKSEIIKLDVWKGKKHLKIYAIYNPPNNNPIFHAIGASNQSIFIGDFNAHSPLWGYQDINAAGLAVQDLLNSSTFELVFDRVNPSTYLHYNGTCTNPDLLLVTADIRHKTLRTVLDDPGSGHRQILADIELDSSESKPYSLSKTSWNFKRANWCLFRALMDSELRQENFDFDLHPDRLYNAIREKFWLCAKKCIPRGKIKKFRPFWNEDLENMKIKRNRLRRKAELTHRSCDIIAWRRQSAILKREIVAQKRASFRDFISHIDYQKDSGKAFKYIANIKKENIKSRKTTFKVIDKVISSDHAIANAFVQHFTGTQFLSSKARKLKKMVKHKLKIACKVPSKSPEVHPIFETLITNGEFSKAIDRLKIGKSPGDDGIHAEFLCHLGPIARQTLLRFFNLVWRTGVIPSHWRRSIIIPIHKKDRDPQLLNGYRPIALTSILGKVMERIVVERLNWFLETNRLIAEEQAGFRQYRSTNQQVALLSQTIKDALDNQHVLSAIFIDFKSAYDLVWRERLLLKLSDLGVSQNMLNFFRGFHGQRTCRVRYGSSLSKWRLLKTGLPQGAISSCSLFNVYINDLVLLLRTIPGVNCLLYADDLVIYTDSPKRVAKQLNERKLGKALSTLEEWCNLNNMTVNIEKTATVSFSLTHQPFHLDLIYDSQPVRKSDCYTYLGVSFDRKLSWNLFTEEIISRVANRLSMLKRLAGCKWGSSSQTLKLTFKSFILPLMTYCCEPLVSTSGNNLTNLERVFNQALRLITGAIKTTPLDAMYMYTGLRSIKSVIQEKALLLWERIRRIPGSLDLWKDIPLGLDRNLKTQLGFIQGVLKLERDLHLLWEPEPLSLPPCPTETFDFRVYLDLSQEVFKRDTAMEILRTIALETINTLYPEPDWLRIYTDGSRLLEGSNAGAGVHCTLFSFANPVGIFATAFDGELMAIKIALSQLTCHIDKFSKAVILSDSRSSLQALMSTMTSLSSVVIKCRRQLQCLYANNKEIVFQWIPGHCGIHGNEIADSLAKRGAEILQTSPPAVPLETIKRIIKNTMAEEFKKNLAHRTSEKPWRDKISFVSKWPRQKMVAEFRLATGHDCLRKHLHRFQIASSPLCSLCDLGQPMDADHLAHCPALFKRSPADRYWEARDLLDS